VTVESAKTPRNQPAATALRLRVRLLGAFDVSFDGKSTPDRAWRSRKARAIVKLLALEPSQTLPRERLTGLLWPDLGPREAANNLRVALHAARGALASVAEGHPTLVQSGESLRLGEAPAWIDAAAFATALAEARQVGDPAAYESALALYRGELLPGDAYEEWTEVPRATLRAAYRRGLTELAQLAEARGDADEAMAAFERVLRAEPSDEPAHAALMRLHAAAGRRHAALQQYRMLREALRRDLDTEPSPETRRLYEEIMAGRGAAPAAQPDDGPAQPSGNLPHAYTSFVGREREVAAVRNLLRRARLVTLVGPGGAGKTRLALEVARDVQTELLDGAWLVELGSTTDPALVPAAAAAALGLSQSSERPALQALVEACGTRELLIVLDNCEHLLEACVELVHQLLTACPRVRVLATSRERLGITGESPWVVPALSLPGRGAATGTGRAPARGGEAVPRPDGPSQRPERPPDASRSSLAAGRTVDGQTHHQLLAYEAIRLFLDRASLSRPGFVLTAANASSVLKVCRRLDGLPLAIELAAARIATLPVEEIAARLDERLRFLAGNRAAPERHRSLRAAIDWSYTQLDRDERRLFAHLAVFAGGFSFQAAEAVEDEEVLGPLTRLVEKSLLVFEPSDEGGGRYRLLETLREYAWEQLRARDDAEETSHRHAAFFLALAETAAPQLRGPRQGAWLHRLDRERDNLRAALEWFTRTDDAESGLRLGCALVRYWEMRSLRREGRSRLERLLALPSAAPRTALRAQALSGTHVLAHQLSDFAAAIPLAEESLAIAREIGDEMGIARALYHLGVVATLRSDHVAARPLLEESIPLFRRAADTHWLAWALLFLGNVALAQSSLAEAETLLEESLSLRRDGGEQRGIGIALCALALVVVQRGEHTRAHSYLAEGLQVLASLDDRWFVAMGLTGAALAAAHGGDPRRAVQLAGAANAIAESIRAALPPYIRDIAAAALDVADADLSAAEYEAAWDEGRALRLHQAVALAAAAPEQRGR
jgi:predicted ATPase/DNA-binding SARP family transcriptional activator